MRLRVARPFRRTLPLLGPFYVAPSRRRRSNSGSGWFAAFFVLLVLVGLGFEHPIGAAIVGGVALILTVVALIRWSGR